jgi:NOL1/NOP2/fmu family ribosome biogenesis protein
MLVTTHAGQLYAVAPETPPLAGMRIVRAGLWLGTLQRDRFEPSHSLALALRAPEAQQVLSLAPDDERLGRYLAGHPLPEPGPKGWLLVAVDGFPIGWGRRAGDVVKNAYPKGLRRSAG